MVAIENPAVRHTQDSATAVSSPAAETAILTTTLQVAGGALPGHPVKIVATINITAGTGTTAVVVRCRQGSGLGGALVGAALTDTLAAGASTQAVFVFRDLSGFMNQAAGGQYTISVAQTGNTVAGTVNDIDVVVEQ